MPVETVAQVEQDVEILKTFFHAYVKFDDARLHFLRTAYLRGDAQTTLNTARAALQAAAREAGAVAERVKGVKP